MVVLFQIIQKSMSAAIFGILLLLAFILTAPMAEQAYFGLYRYDYLLIFALVIQGLLLYLKLENWAEAKVIALFHVMAMGMELFLTNPAIASWQYPQPALFKLYTVPLFAGFMYSAVGSFFARGLRLFQIEFVQLPTWSSMFILAILSYSNFMTKFFIPDIRWLLFAISTVLFWRTKVYFSLNNINFYQLPMLCLLWFLAGIIWLAENISTFYKIWVYPSQLEHWHRVGWGKLGSWYLLLLLSLVLVLKILEKQKTTLTKLV